MARFTLLSLLSCCMPAHEPVAPPAPRIALDTLRQRTMTLQEASEEIWRPELRPGYRPPTAAETEAIEVLVPELLHAAASGDLDPGAVARASAVAMRIERWDVGGTHHLVLSEVPDQRRGAGAYLFSLDHPASTTPWLLWEAPHAYYDLNTGTIAGSLYFGPPAGPAPSAFFTNTVHRYTQADGKRSKQAVNPADACHSEAHLFNVATQAAARAVAGATVVQLHGFAAGAADDDGADTPSRLPANVLAVVSAGEKSGPSALSSAAAARLATLLGPGVLLYPTQAQALGATTNVEMAGLRSAPGARFLHIETVGALRDLLVQDAAKREAVGAALFALATTP